MIYDDGSIYTGHTVDGVPAGDGKLQYSDGSSFRGRVNGNLLDGSGVFKKHGAKYDGAPSIVL